ncbi:DUF6862 domain-containing protein [Janthinobacterium agaricidamnosum]|uniref:DUF6862 domain-containing protein n=1 Tax=Janthinobacterium agaricidamnosum TaxID=55508 RepID=UPI000A85E14D|nr:hypothetical protein [Janthinobacterium agaricidamnosum]
MITDAAAQRALTGKGAEETVAGVNRNVTTGVDTSGKIGNNFDKQALQATIEVTQAFAAAAAKQVGDYASNKLNEATALAKQASEEPDPVKSAELQRQSDELKANWKEDGPARVALHTAVGALAGGTNGALGASAAALSTDSISKQLQTLDIPDTLRSALTLAAGAAIGAVVGGEAGANSALNEVANNYLKHKREGMKKSEQEQFDAAVAACSSSNPDACARRDSLIKLSTERDTLIGNVCSSGPSKDCSSLVSAAYGEGYKVIFGSDKKAYVYLQGSPELRAVPDPRDGTYHYAQAASLRDGLELAGTDLVVGKALGGIAAGGKYVYDGFVNGVRNLLDDAAKAAPRFIEGPSVPVRNAELISSDGAVFSRQNSLTGTWEPVVPSLSSAGGDLLKLTTRDTENSIIFESIIDSTSVNARVGLRESLAAQAGIPRAISNVWGSSLEDLQLAFKMDGLKLNSVPPKSTSSGNAQIFSVEGRSDVAQVQFSPENPFSSHKGQYYKIEFTDGSQAKIIDPKTYKLQFDPKTNLPTLDKNTIFYNPQGKIINYVNGRWK